jgi:hypothetical protein
MGRRAIFAWGAMGIAPLVGTLACASVASLPERGEADFSGTVHRPFPSVRAGEVRVVGSRINPLRPVTVATDGNEVAVAFARQGRIAAVARLDARSLAPRSVDEERSDAAPAAEGDTRVDLEDGSFALCWVRGDDESGHRALVQTFHRNGVPRGAPVVLSPADVDVVGAPRAVTTDGFHLVVTFAAATQNTFEVLAVPVDDVAYAASGESVARK